jgi:hypothetical protein
LNTGGQQLVYATGPATTYATYEQPTTTYTYEQPGTTTTTTYLANEGAERFYSGKYPTGGATNTTYEYTYTANEPYVAKK